MKEILGIKTYGMEETAKLLGVTTRTIQTYLISGKLKGQKIGRIWHIREENIKDFITNNHN